MLEMLSLCCLLLYHGRSEWLLCGLTLSLSACMCMKKTSKQPLKVEGFLSPMWDINSGGFVRVSNSFQLLQQHRSLETRY